MNGEESEEKWGRQLIRVADKGGTACPCILLLLREPVLPNAENRDMSLARTDCVTQQLTGLD